MKLTQPFSRTQKTAKQDGIPTTMIHLAQVVKVYPSPSNPVTALKGISMEVRRGEFLAITGRSSAGKTTLLNLLTGLDHLTSGEIWVDDTAVHRLNEEQATIWRGKNVGVIFQSFQLIPTLTVLQNVTLPMDFAARGSLRQRQERNGAIDAIGNRTARLQTTGAGFRRSAAANCNCARSCKRFGAGGCR
jgi:putative ABC transport system ATP-binding protein